MASPESKLEVFTDVETYPEMTFRATSIEGDGGDYKLTGALAIKGVTKPVELEVESRCVAVDPFGATRAGASAEAEISRKDFGLTWNAVLEAGGVLVSEGKDQYRSGTGQPVLTPALLVPTGTSDFADAVASRITTITLV